MNKKELGLALLAELDKGYDIVRLSRWAFKVFASQDPRFLSDDKRELLIELSSMEDDPQFEYSEEELRALSSTLIAEGEKEELSADINTILEKAKVLDEDWLMCPLCYEAFPSHQTYKFVTCTNCQKKLQNPRFDE